jgi:SIR2-like domain
VSVSIPEELVRLVANRRVIPFIGAGFSSSHGLPGWDELLSKIAADLRLDESEPKLEYEEIRRLGNDDVLAIAEYLFLRAGASIGPLRHSMTTALQSALDPVRSTPHLELVNLGAPQIYTTNFDEIIEETYHALGVPVQVLARSRDVATADPVQTQLVKYHGDLRYDTTIVLTESQYWNRLDLESPMDLKFRSDLLGKSVLFMGYTFRDINIRVVWFKLMQMMRDVPLSDRSPSYMVRFEPNPVLEALYEAVGLHTIVLDPDGTARDNDARTALLSEFLYRLTYRSSQTGNIPGSGNRMFASLGLIEAAAEQFAGAAEREFGAVDEASWLPTLLRRQVPPGLLAHARDLVANIARNPSYEASSAAGVVAIWGLQWAPANEVTLAAARALAGSTRVNLIRANPDWERLWAGGLTDAAATYLLQGIESEIAGHEDRRLYDDDIAFGVDLLKRIANGSIPLRPGRPEIVEMVTELLSRAAAMYPAVEEYDPVAGEAPNPRGILAEINERRPPDWERRVSFAGIKTLS